ncbi:Ser/Thr protein phosphatase [Histomonas meleagridis]|uniref:Ser/Thr protein phosphatase n=1 Tax=Histomonas meleagridis TaxID=135588 RepID=UPI00355A097F|nr:Ser/Thr protein phosphatase [Histomonas meleagridis]KAH0797078.1 Ser/Thr protein phosphatase [Histomonas meleagridis]
MDCVNTVLGAFLPLLNIPLNEFEQIGKEKYPLPTFVGEIVQQILDNSIILFQCLPNVLKLEGNIYVIGDIHGNIRDLIRIFNYCQPKPPGSKFLFLGDYVDRGEYSVEVILLLLAMALRYPENIFLLRGNHEYEAVNSHYGFKDQVMSIYGSKVIYEKFQKVFSHLPIAAVIAEKTFCVHGGLSPHLGNISVLDTLDRTQDPPCQLIIDIMWSDPSVLTETFMDSARGNGCCFGITAINEFCAINKFVRVIRAHQFTKSGISKVGNNLITVFSTCNYKGEGSNQAGIIKVLKDNQIETFAFLPISTLPRSNACFKRVRFERTLKSLNSFRIILPFRSGSRNTKTLPTSFTTSDIPKTQHTKERRATGGVYASKSFIRESSSCKSDDINQFSLPRGLSELPIIREVPSNINFNTTDKI